MNATNHADAYAGMRDGADNERYLELDFNDDRKMLIGAERLSRCFDVDASTIRRWAGNGTMPKPLKVGGRTLWDVEAIREWIRGGCQTHLS